MAIDRADELWQVTFETWYDTYYHELLADDLVNRWQWLDEVSKVLVSGTASGSAISGLALWSQPGFRAVWIILAGTAALLGWIHTALRVPDRLKDQGEIKRRFASLRADLDTFRYRMRLNPEFPVDTFTREFVEYRKRFSDNIQLLRNDILVTRRRRIKVQKQLNTKVETT